MVCEEPHAPYDRPPLSKDVLLGTREPGPLRKSQWYADNEVELLLGVRASGLDHRAHRVELAGGTGLRYGALVIATGSRPRRIAALPLGDGVYELRTRDDAVALRAELAGAPREIAIVGAGLVGMEVASSAAKLGHSVTLIEAMESPLARALPLELGLWLSGLHSRAGIDVRHGVEVLGIERHGDGSVAALPLSDGQRVPADLVLVAAGTVPAVDWLAHTPLGGGQLRVDGYGRTVLPAVYAAGDAACYPDPASGRHVSTQHWEAAARQGADVGRTIAGLEPRPAAPGMFWSDQHGIRLQYVGHGEGAEEVEFDGDPGTGDFTAWILAEGRPVAALLAGRPHALPDARERIAEARGDLLMEAA
jgi:NADPH-dependent 2,4-dienoyl-CoA reductase/sulfur reductase-like enzyme